MTDREITILCATAMGWKLSWWSIQNPDSSVHVLMEGNGHEHTRYDPLSDDAQAMALVKKLGISIRKIDPDLWNAWIPLEPADAASADLNRAIVECVSKVPAFTDIESE